MTGAAGGRRADVLVIDDDEIVRCAIADALEEAGFSVEELPSPIGATRLIIQREVKVVVLDVHLPAMRGDNLARLFRKNEKLSDVKVILISGADVAELRSLAESAQVDDMVSKAEGFDAVVRKVRRLMPRA